jgi:hypothetical protein
VAKSRREPLRFPRLDRATLALVGKENTKDPKRLHRALVILDAAEKSGIDVYSGVKILASYNLR